MNAASGTSAARRPLRLAWGLIREVRSPRWGLAGQGLRFLLSGALVGVVYISITTLLNDALGVRFQIALAVGFLVAVAVNFTLQRVFVWRHYGRFALARRHQAVRYLGMGVCQYGITVVSTSQLPGALGLPVELVYVATAILVTGSNFIIIRHRVFHELTPGSGRS